ncbi:ISLre2 family transposase [Streptococcus mutans]|nr:ISLre2 family transposase [Streptococcus mutans]MDT9554869.1 ISLre2 family transposase [Streptococcus mutans]MDT9574516.1 ISLre2 family transposase [Streptococcus mutans]MDT9578073.1 ISLre2 family transposase [Streptococcus mutans]
MKKSERIRKTGTSKHKCKRNCPNFKNDIKYISIIEERTEGMDTKVIDERQISRFFQENNRKTFLKMIARYENYIAPIMRANGYTRINQKERTVVFSFGEMTFSRSRWKKDGKIRIPVDEKLGLVPRARYSKELIYQLTELANFMPYRKVVTVVEELKQIYITKNSVQRALETAGKLLAGKEDYRILALPEGKMDRIEPETLYIEGDGVWVKQTNTEQQSKSMELTHFVVHTGSQQGNRNTLTNKFEIVSTQHKKAKEQLLDLIYNRFKITPETVIITNSDGGLGYSPRFFKELIAGFRSKRHYHFWDPFHVNKILKMNLNGFPSELTTRAFQAIQHRSKKEMQTVLETAESLIETDDKLESFRRFKSQLLENFSYTAKPEHKGLSSAGIGIVESQHRKITYRMKNRGMYWSQQGADIMSQTILLTYKGELRDLFFGQWRTDYEKMQSLEEFTADYFMQESEKNYFFPVFSVSKRQRPRLND